jgi:Leucine-rich repeat (LRR) protein
MNDALLKNLVSNCTKLDSLNLAYCSDVTDDSLVELAKTCPKIQELVLWGCYNTTNVTLEALAANCKSIRSLSLKCCKKISDAGLIHMQALTQLEDVNLTYCRNITDFGLQSFLSGVPKLRSLCMAYCSNITDVTVGAVMKHCPHLEKLDLTQCNISDAGLKYIAANPETSCLQELNLTSCQSITCSGISHLLKLVGTLKVLTIEDCTSLRVDAVPVQELTRRGVSIVRF